MTKVDIISGFLGAGKTTLIKKLLKESSMKDEQVVLIENEFGEIGIDGGFLADAGIEIREMNSGCICCSLVGDFKTALEEVIETYHPDRIVIEPSGVGALSDVIGAVQNAMHAGAAALNSATTVVDVKKCKLYTKNFGEFFNNQIQNAGTIVLSRTGSCKKEKLEEALGILRTLNDKATVITTDWEALTGEQILAAMESKSSLDVMLEEMKAEQARREAEGEDEECCHHHHHDHDHDECCHHDHEEHEHHHDHEEQERHHDHDHEEHEHHHDHEEHEHHHDHDECCHHDHEHEHHHHHHHHADDVFTSWGFETPKAYSAAKLQEILGALGDSDTYGLILRAKGMVPAEDGTTWLHFDMVPEETEIREGSAEVTGKICVIGSKIHEEKLKALFEA